MTLENYAVAAAALIGIINGIKLLETNVRSFAYFVAALALGVLIGYFGLFGLPSGVEGIETGVMLGLASSGLYKVATKFGGK